jgi:hypothetical protein
MCKGSAGCIQMSPLVQTLAGAEHRGRSRAHNQPPAMLTI